jgi:hypothetical protein
VFRPENLLNPGSQLCSLGLAPVKSVFIGVHPWLTSLFAPLPAFVSSAARDSSELPSVLFSKFAFISEIRGFLLGSLGFAPVKSVFIRVHPWLTSLVAPLPAFVSFACSRCIGVTSC